MIKKMIKLTYSSAIRTLGFDSARHLFHRQFTPPPYTVFLMYHRIIPEKIKKDIYSVSGIVVSQENFDRQMNFLKKNYEVLSIDAYIEAVRKKTKIKKKTAVITFDDGYEDNYLYAFPVLKSYGFPAIIYTIANYVDKCELYWHEKLIYLGRRLIDSPPVITVSNPRLEAHIQSILKNNSSTDWVSWMDKLKKLPIREIEQLILDLEQLTGTKEYPFEKNKFLSRLQMLQLIKENVQIGSHTTTHALLTDEKEDVIRKELTMSKRILEEITGTKIAHFAYPNGLYNELISQMVSEAGYQSAVTTVAGLNDGVSNLYQLKRINMHDSKTAGPFSSFSPDIFSAYLTHFL